MGFFDKNKIHVGNSMIFFLLSILLFVSMITFIHVPYLVKDEENSRNANSIECSRENYTSLKDLSNSDFNKSNTKYKADNYNVVYHDLEADINVQSGIYKTQNNFYTVLDKDGKMRDIAYYGNDNPTMPTYNVPGSFIYGPSSYIPTYEDTIYLSKTTGLTTTKELTPEYNYIGGFCQQYQHSKIELEKRCNMIPKDQCSATTCCVLLGGSKCVSGDEKGPYRNANYTDTTIRDKDYYYYKGKCHGRCDRNANENDSSDDEE
jgi:hypothetical protein